MLYPHFAQRQTTTHITGQELPSPGEVKIPGPYRPHEHHCSCKTHLQLCPIDPKIFLFWKVFWFLLQTECHGSSSFKANTTHLNWCKGGGKEKQSFFKCNSKQPPTQKTAGAWSTHLQRFALYVHSLTPHQSPMVITVFCCFICLIQLLFQHFSQFYTTQNFQKDALSFPDRQNFCSLINTHTRFPRYAKLLFSDECTAKLLVQFSSFSAESWQAHFVVQGGFQEPWHPGLQIFHQQFSALRLW